MEDTGEPDTIRMIYDLYCIWRKQEAKIPSEWRLTVTVYGGHRRPRDYQNDVWPLQYMEDTGDLDTDGSPLLYTEDTGDPETITMMYDLKFNSIQSIFKVNTFGM